MKTEIDTESLISIVTPVYNGERYLQECIENVINQTYRNWEYIILNNCSTDTTLDIANKYAAIDRRIHVYSNDSLLPIMQNWNRALSFISDDSQYCKIVHADDWLFPECLQKMAAVADADSEVGVVGSYGLVGKRVKCDGLDYSCKIISGREISRQTLLGKFYLFWSPSSLMIRSDIIRNRIPFYDEESLHADISMLYEILYDTKFGFVHQVLTFIRMHEESMTSSVAHPMNMIDLSNLELLTVYGKKYLSEAEYSKRLDDKINEYYRRLIHNLFELRDGKFWEYQKKRLEGMGQPLNIGKLVRMSLIEFIKHPLRYSGKTARALTGRA